MVQDQLASKERYSKAPELALWATASFRTVVTEGNLLLGSNGSE